MASRLFRQVKLPHSLILVCLTACALQHGVVFNSLRVMVNNEAFTDPCPHTRKMLRVTYHEEGLGAKLHEAWEGDIFWICGYNIVIEKAIYTDPKDEGRSVDVTSKIKALLTSKVDNDFVRLTLPVIPLSKAKKLGSRARRTCSTPCAWRRPTTCSATLAPARSRSYGSPTPSTAAPTRYL